MHHVAVGDLVLLAFQPQLPGLARAGLATRRNVIVVRDGLGTDCRRGATSRPVVPQPPRSREATLDVDRACGLRALHFGE
jgi:hypothetical protein